MFKLEPNPTFWAPVEIHVPGQGKGRIEVEYRYLDRAARQAYFDGLADKTNLEALCEIIVGWREIDAPYSKASLTLLLNKYNAAGPLYQAFFDELSGAAEKN